MKTIAELRELHHRRGESIGRDDMYLCAAAESLPVLLDALDEAERRVDNLAMLIRTIAGYPKTRDARVKEAVDYLIREGLQGSILRDNAGHSMQRDVTCSACGDLDGCHRWQETAAPEEPNPHAGQDAIAYLKKLDERVRIWSIEHNAWWRPDSCGYTADIAGAGLYSPEEAAEIVKSSLGKDEVAIRQSSAVPKCVDELISAAIRIDKKVELLGLIDAVIDHYDEVHASDLPGAAEHASGDWDTEHECDRPDCRRCGRYEP